MSITLKQYPSGVRTIDGRYDPRYDTDKVIVKNMKLGDPDIHRLISLVRLNRISHISSLDKLDFIKAAKRLFGNFDEFVRYNLLHNNVLHGKDLDFLMDTVSFINGGHRSFSIEMWMNYLDRDPKRASDIPCNEHHDVEQVGANYIVKWLNQPNGFSDLVSTLIILFGLKMTDPRDITNGII